MLTSVAWGRSVGEGQARTGQQSRVLGDIPTSDDGDHAKCGQDTQPASPSLGQKDENAQTAQPSNDNEYKGPTLESVIEERVAVANQEQRRERKYTRGRAGELGAVA